MKQRTPTAHGREPQVRQLDSLKVEKNTAVAPCAIDSADCSEHHQTARFYCGAREAVSICRKKIYGWGRALNSRFRLRFRGYGASVAISRDGTRRAAIANDFKRPVRSYRPMLLNGSGDIAVYARCWCCWHGPGSTGPPCVHGLCRRAFSSAKSIHRVRPCQSWARRSPLTMGRPPICRRGIGYQIRKWATVTAVAAGESKSEAATPGRATGRPLYGLPGASPRRRNLGCRPTLSIGREPTSITSARPRLRRGQSAVR